ncbi:MAG: ABC transporter permease [Deltaproteobacteria bacterium]|nr:ABC transporter permease [Deltaproteobacteria bacterium]
MTSGKREEPQAGSADTPFPIRFVRESLAIAEVELKKLLRDPTEMFTRAVQPVLWIVIFGQVFSRVRGIPTGKISYLSFMAPGILAQSVLFSAIFYGIAVIWERDLGIIHKLLVSPARRMSLVFGKAISSGFRGVAQVVVIYVLALVMGVGLRWQAYALIGVLFSVVLGSAIFSTFSLIVACIVKTRERFMGIGQLLTMPLFFASNAIYPLSLMPGWLQWFARLNPLTYLVDSLRGLMIMGGHSIHSFGTDCGIMLLVFLLFLLIADRLYPTLVQ